MNSPVTPNAPSLPTLEILNASGTQIDAVPCIKAGGHDYTRNRQGFQAYQSDTQNASGDGRRQVGERNVDVLVEKTSTKSAERRMYELQEAMESCATLRLSGVSIAISGSRGITASQPLSGDRTGDYRATLTYLPTTQAATNESGEAVLGPL